jgi:scyllo-inositol 2-dehydrogenase (NADP+)
MADRSPLRGAILGYGLAGSVFHAPLVAATPGLEVAAITTSDPERAERARREHPGAEVLPDPAAALDRADSLDFAVVATPNDSHVQLARAALDAGLAVVVDKPLAPSADEARGLVLRARDADRPLTVFLNRRWDSDQLTLRRLLDEGKLGTVLRYESMFERWRPELAPEGVWREQQAPEAGGGLLLDIGPHLVDQAIVLFGPPTHVYAEVEHRRGGAADDDVFVALRHEGAVLSHLWTSAVAAEPGPRLRVWGDRGTYVVDSLDGQEDSLKAGERPGAGGEWGLVPREDWGRFMDGAGAEPVPSEPGDWPAFYSAFERCLRDGGPPPVAPDDAVAGLEVLDAARLSAARREVIELR